MKAARWLMFASLFAGCASAQTASGDTGGVTGVVTDAVTHLPVKKATVSINGIVGNGAPSRLRNSLNDQQSRAAITDASGSFTIPNLPAGAYQLLVQHQNYPQARFGGIAKNVEIKAGETAGPVTVELIPGASVSGRIVDEDGDPIRSCFAQPHPAAHPEQGVSTVGSSSSDDDGEYRVYGIAPGKYVLAAQCPLPAFQPRPFSAGPDPPPSRAYPIEYYPLTTDAKAAGTLELAAGAERTGVDFRMKPAPVTQVRGAFSPTGADWHGAEGALFLQLAPLDQASRNFVGPQVLNQAKGTFEFQPVFPGSYVLIVQQRGARGGDGALGAAQRIEVGDRPVDVVVELRHAIDLSGRVEIEGGSSAGGQQQQLTPAQIGIQLVPQYPGAPGSNAQAADDGSFTLKGVMPGTFRVQANGPNVFLKSAWLGGTDVTSAPVDLTSGAAGATLRIVLSTNTATIRGSAPAGHMIFAQNEGDNGSSRVTEVDQSGQYRMEGLAPGKYRLALTDVGIPVPDDAGQEVAVHEGETIMVDVKPQQLP